MRYEYRLPDIGEGIAEAELVGWHVKPGDHVEEGTSIADVMTDKATVEIEAPVAGIITERTGDVGDTVAIGSVLLVIETDHAEDTAPDPVAPVEPTPSPDRALPAAPRPAAALNAPEKPADPKRRILASPAVRVVETVGVVAAGYGAPIDPAWDRRVYLASSAMLLDVVRETPGDAGRLLLVGHNPGLEDLVLLLVPHGGGALREEVEEKYPTATLAELTFDIDDWADAAPGRATLTRFVRPRDVDAALGPGTD